MNYVTIAATLLIAISACAQTAFGQTNTPRIDNRESRQESRVEQGKTSGALTNREAAKLDAGQAKVDGMQNAAKADGKVTQRERTAIKKEQNKQSRKIYRQKHDAQKKAPA
jgi:uncharacterized membrane protein YebE (DUF533 family)